MEVADWVNHSEVLPFLTFVPITNPIALRAVALELHPDPADRLIAATAPHLGATLVTKDEKLAHVPKLRTLW
jgi:PIN domain nuclease of toxin-antitoxin system